MTTFAERLSKTLTDCKISQRDLAKRIGLNETAISHFCNGRRDPSLGNLSKIVRELWFTDARWLITGDKL